ncbi:hypothetical protein [Halorussus halophilus]|uniref:hypothetical protein n=1 Tax=Halorussus halophilus TaxID=2650975 RepID=UPI00130134F7|nr:hypothetical protein [Halorussus halophilus]
MASERLSRRGFLALAATGALAGCNALPEPFSEDQQSPKLDASELEAMASEDGPDVSPPNPVAVEQSYFDESVARVEKRLETVPAPLDSDDVPNEAIRKRLVGAYERANDELDALSGAEPSVAALDDVRRARENAQFAATAWEVITTDRTRRDVARQIPEIRSDLDAFRGRWQYLGDDPIQAVFVHETIESLVGIADRHAERNQRQRYADPQNPLAVGEFAGRLEEARAAVADASYLYDQFEGSLDSARNLRPTFEQTSESLGETLAKRRSRLPTTTENGEATFVERDISETLAERALEELFRDARYSNLDEFRTEGRYAHAVLEAHSDLAEVRAFRSLRKQVEDGRNFTIESAADVKSLRATAVEAISNAPSQTRYGRLAREVAWDLSGYVEYADEEFGRIRSSPRADWVHRDVVNYLTATEIARAVPSASDDVGDELRD